MTGNKERERISLRKIIDLALAEDRIHQDVTTNALRACDRVVDAVVVAKEAGVISGVAAFRETMKTVDPRMAVKVLKGEGQRVNSGDIVLRLRGRESAILKGERTALNFLQRLCGVATLTRRFSDVLRPFRTRLLDTRKTTPGMRYLEKRAVRSGGGRNHRFHLQEMALIKDNHIVMAGGIAAAVDRVRRHLRRLPRKRIEVEVKSLAELHEALAAGVDWIMLDNFSPAQIRRAVALNRGRARLEVSGNVTLQRLIAIARCGVDFVSVGALTHSFRALDLSLEILTSPKRRHGRERLF